LYTCTVAKSVRIYLSGGWLWPPAHQMKKAALWQPLVGG
jgi:hypothetical protein